MIKKWAVEYYDGEYMCVIHVFAKDIVLEASPEGEEWEDSREFIADGVRVNLHADITSVYECK